MAKFFFTGLFVFISIWSRGQLKNLEKIIESDSTLTSSIIAKEYLKNLPFENIETFISDTQYLISLDYDINLFVSNILNEYYNQNVSKIDINYLEHSFKIGYKIHKYYKSDTLKYIYLKKIYEYFLTDVADKLQKGISEKKIDPDDVTYLIIKLKDFDYHINIRVNNYKKFFYHLKNGNFKYLYQKLTGPYLKEATIFLFILITITFSFRKIFKSMRKKNKVLLFLVIGIVSISFKSEITTLPESGFVEGLSKTLYNGDVQLIRLLKNQQFYGHAIWLNREPKKIKVKYFASGIVYNKYSSWKKRTQVNSGKIILLCSGAYSNNLDAQSAKPVGLSVDNGAEVNKIIDYNMDALVIIEAVGGIRVSNIDEGNLFIVSLNKTLDVKNPNERIELFDWAKKESATIFQTHLLIWKNLLTFLPIQADGKNSKPDKRRLLAIGKDLYSNLTYVLIDIEQEVKLSDIAMDISNYLIGQKKMQVTALLNLDRGAYDCLNFYDENGVSLVSGQQDCSKTTNLISIYRD